MRLYKLTCIAGALCLILSGSLSYAETNQSHKFGELTDIARKWKTDKARHNYTEVYEYFFYPIKYEAKKICEIGIESGSSLKMFRNYFPESIVYGIDIDNKSHLDSRTIKTFVADQSDRKRLADFINTYGGDFDIILDDGGHTMEQQQVSFGALFKYVKPGGYYIIEDVHTSLKDENDTYGVEKGRENTTLAMINNFIKDGKIISKYMTQEESDYLSANIAYCNLLAMKPSSITCIFKKKQ